jgi:pantetheine-phosphate adenylyltransferase
MKRVAIYPGSFDPLTNGHEDIIRRSLKLVDRLIVAVAVNPSKTPLLSVDRRIELMEEVLAEVDGAECHSFDGLLADFAEANEATVVVRGLRAVSDFEFEFQMALMNRKLKDDLETIFLVPALNQTFLSSSLVREVARFGGDVSSFVHPAVADALAEVYG